jgi:RHS repeat-associated protein
LANQFPNNQWIRGNGDSYDPAGNQTSIGSYTSPSVASSNFTFDAENRMTRANIGGTGWMYYAYDGNGRRMMKVVGSTTTQFVYDAAGNLAAEYSTGTSAATGTQYLITDALGSTRMVLDASGAAMQRIDYLPFGEEIPAGYGGRGSEYSAGSYPTSSQLVDQKFTGKERDAETGLDYFGARYFSGAQGRFASPDEVFADQHPGDPQSWNLYAYSRNNPLRYADPNGHSVKSFVQILVDAAEADVGLSFGATAAFLTLFEGSAGSGSESDVLKRFQEEARKADAEKEANQEPEPDASSSSGRGVKKGGGKDAGRSASTSSISDPSANQVPATLETNPKHNMNSVSPEPPNVRELYQNSIPDKSGVRWAKDTDGTIHRFSAPSNGRSHWNGSTAGPTPIRRDNIPIQIRRALQ